MNINQAFENILINFTDMDRRIAAIPGETADMPRNHIAPYLYIEMKRDAYIDALEAEEKVEALKNLIAVHLYFKDFVYAEKYINQYIADGYDEDGRMSKLWCELCSLLERIKVAVAERNERAVIVILVDSLGLPLLDRMPFLKKLAKESAHFTNMYSPGSNTRPSLLSIFNESYLLDNGTYIKHSVSRQDSKFLTQLESEGIFFDYYSVDSVDYLERTNATGRLDNQSSIYWNMLTDLTGKHGRMVLFAHTYEMHSPYYNGEPANKLIDCFSAYCDGSYIRLFGGEDISTDAAGKWLYNYEKQQYYDTLDYVDRQIEFYYNLFNARCSDIIVMSDHGMGVTRAYYDTELMREEFEDPNIRITFIVNSRNVAPCENDKLNSSIDFCKIVNNLLSDKKTLDISERSYFRIDALPIYDESYILRLLSIGVPLSSGGTEITEEKASYRLYLDGYEFQIDEISQTHDFTNNARYFPLRQANRARLEYFRGLIDYDPREIWRNMFEKYPHMPKYYPDIMEKLECNLRYMNDFSIIDNGPYVEEFENFWNSLTPDEPVAIFGMGKAFEILYACVIENAPRRNVVCVIDNTYCKQRDSYKGFTIVSTGDSKGFEYNKIFINGFLSREAMLADLTEHGISAEIIDIYDMLEKKGMVYNKPFIDYSYYDDLQLRKNAK